MINFLISLIAPFAYFITKQKEKRLGYRLDFSHLNKEWLATNVVYEMDAIWKAQGLDAIGTNYFTIGSLKNNKSTRFDSDSPYFQSWIGGYIVKFSQKKKWTINDHFKLGVADQINWLKTYDDKNPKVYVVEDKTEEIGDIIIDGFNGTLYRGNIMSDTDISNTTVSFINKGFIAGLVYYMNQDNKQLNITIDALLPKAIKSLDPFQNIELRGYIAILDLPENTKVVLYTNAANFTEKNGTIKNNFNSIDQDLLDSLKSIKITSL